MRNMILISAALLAGCAAPAKLYNSAPSFTFTSTKPIDEVSRCLQLRYGASTTQMAPGTVTIPVPGMYGTIDGYFDLTPSGAGTHIAVKSLGSHSLGPCA